MNFQDMIATLTRFWAEKGCLVHQGYDLEVGAGTFNPATFLRCLGPEPYAAVYVEPSRRPKDGRYGENPNRVQFYHQMQVIIKPSPPDIQDLYLESLKSIGLDLSLHDIRFVHDDWENPTIGAWGLGWEVWADGMEVTQFTYFQAVGGLPVKPVSGEITYGLERLALYIQGVDSFFDLKVNDQITYGDLYKRSEWEWSHYNFHEADDKMWLRHFEDFEKEALQLMKRGFPIPAYDFVMKCSHAFNILDARGVISVTERTAYMGRIRALARQLAEHYVKSREEQNFPLLRFHEEKMVNSIQPPASTACTPDETQDFLLEIGSEELPATFVPIGMQSLERLVQSLLKTSGLKHGDIKVFGTPRRLAILVKDLAGGSQASSSVRKGPSLDAAFNEDGTPTKAGSGFFQSIGCGNPTRMQVEKGEISCLECKQIKGVSYLYARIETAGQSTRALLAAELPKIILNIDFPKKMRWGALDIEYARPLRWIVALYGNEVIPFALGSLLSGRETHGHRQLSPNVLPLKHAKEWHETLKKNWVMPDVSERKDVILSELEKIEAKLCAEVVSKEKVMAQVLHLVEWPFLTTAPFEERFLKAPKEVLVSEMVEHQKYFPLANKEGTLLPHFAIVCNNKPTDLIRKGNQKALFPRLADGMFLYEADLKLPLEHFNEKLKTVTFQKELGSVYAKVERMSCIAVHLHSLLPIAPLEKIKRAVFLSKADLASELVGEFPELQGIIGRLYAAHQGEDKEIASAIDEQWMPRGEKAPLPKTPTGILLSLTEKIDNLFGCFALDLKPSSSSDPYALRRQAFGMLKLLIEHKYHLPLMEVFKEAARCFLESKEISTKASTHIRTELNAILNEIEAFLLSRLRTTLSDYGFEKEEVEAVLSNKLSDVYEKWYKLSELREFRKKHHGLFSQMMETYTRVRKILLSQKNLPSLKVDAQAFKTSEEKNLYENVSAIRNNISLHALAELNPPVSALFDEVKIMDEDEKVKANRLALLQEILDLFEGFADFSKINDVQT